MSFVSLDEDTIDRLIEDAFLNAGKNPPPEIWDAVRAALAPHFRETYAHCRALNAENTELKKRLSSWQVQIEKTDRKLARTKRDRAKAVRRCALLEDEIITLKGKLAAERLHVQQVNQRLSPAQVRTVATCEQNAGTE